MWDLFFFFFGCSMWDLDPWPRNKPRPPALGTQSLSQWTTREVPKRCIIFSFPLFFKIWPKQLQVFGEFCILYSVAQPRPSSTDVTPSVPSMSIPGGGGVTYSLVLPLPGTLWDSSVQFGHSVTELLKVQSFCNSWHGLQHARLPWGIVLSL